MVNKYYVTNCYTTTKMEKKALILLSRATGITKGMGNKYLQTEKIPLAKHSVICITHFEENIIKLGKKCNCQCTGLVCAVVN